MFRLSSNGRVTAMCVCHAHLTRLYCLSLETDKVPRSWRLAKVHSFPKTGQPRQCCPISVTSALCKILETLGLSYGFRQGHSTGDLLGKVANIYWFNYSIYLIKL